MDPGMAAPVVARWLHVSAAIIGVGGLFYVAVVLLPALGKDAPPELLDRVRQRFKRIAHLAIAVLLVTGLYNYLVVATHGMEAWPEEGKRSAYHALMGGKITLALAVFLIAIFSLKPLPAMKANPRLWLGLNLALAAVILFVSAILRRMW